MDFDAELPGTPRLPDAADILLERDVQRLGGALHQRLRGKTPSLFEAAIGRECCSTGRCATPRSRPTSFVSSMRCPLFPPAGRSRAMPANISLPEPRLPAGLGLALRATENPLAASIAAFVIKENVRRMAGRFIVGRDARHARSTLKNLWDQGFGFTVDLLGEATVNAAESETYARRYADLIEFLPGETAGWKANAILDGGPAGPIPREISRSSFPPWITSSIRPIPTAAWSGC